MRLEQMKSKLQPQFYKVGKNMYTTENSDNLLILFDIDKTELKTV